MNEIYTTNYSNLIDFEYNEIIIKSFLKSNFIEYKLGDDENNFIFLLESQNNFLKIYSPGLTTNVPLELNSNTISFENTKLIPSFRFNNGENFIELTIKDDIDINLNLSKSLSFWKVGASFNKDKKIENNINLFDTYIIDTSINKLGYSFFSSVDLDFIKLGLEFNNSFFYNNSIKSKQDTIQFDYNLISFGFLFDINYYTDDINISFISKEENYKLSDDYLFGVLNDKWLLGIFNEEYIKSLSFKLNINNRFLDTNIGYIFYDLGNWDFGGETKSLIYGPIAYAKLNGKISDLSIQSLFLDFKLTFSTFNFSSSYKRVVLNNNIFNYMVRNVIWTGLSPKVVSSTDKINIDIPYNNLNILSLKLDKKILFKEFYLLFSVEQIIPFIDFSSALIFLDKKISGWGGMNFSITIGYI